jgi:cell division protein FtsW
MMCSSRIAEHEADTSSTGYEVFDPIDYVVADNVVDLREARLRRLQEQRRHGRHDVDVLEEDSRLQARRIAREERCERMRIKRDERARRDAQRLAKCPACHWGLFLLTLLLTVLSVPIVYSASTAIALDHHNNADFFFLRQLGYVAIGVTVFLLVSRLNVKQIRAGVWLLYFGSLLGLIATDFTSLGHSLGGVERWMKIGPVMLQVSELAKIGLIGVLADFWSRAARPAQNSLWPWFFAGALTLPVVGLVFAQPHLSAASLLMVLPFAVAFFADVPVKQIFKIGLVLGVLAIGLFAFGKQYGLPGLKSYQIERVAAHFSGADDEQGSDYQVLQSQRALANGGLLGFGPGNSPSKHGFLPAPHTDFILAVIGEEWGLAGIVALLCIYGAMIFFCFHIGHCASSSFEALLCSGVGTLLAIQVICNAGVVTGTLPVTGMPLPLLSYGGSGLICLLMGIGLVLGISREMGRNTETAEMGATDAGTKKATAVAGTTPATRGGEPAGTRSGRSSAPGRKSDRRVGVTA